MALHRRGQFWPTLENFFFFCYWAIPEKCGSYEPGGVLPVRMDSAAPERTDQLQQQAAVNKNEDRRMNQSCGSIFPSGAGLHFRYCSKRGSAVPSKFVQ
jgi:hypothetical protein